MPQQGAVLVALQFTIGWPLDLGNDGDATEFTRVSNTAFNGSIQLSLRDPASVLDGAYETAAGVHTDMAADFCAGLEQAGDLPADSCTVYNMIMMSQEQGGDSFAPPRRAEGSLHLVGRRQIQEQEQELGLGMEAELTITFYFRLQIDREYLPDRDEVDLHSAVETNLLDTVRIGRLVNAMRQAGNGTLQGVTSANGLNLDLIARDEVRESEPPPLPSSSPSPSTTPSTSPSPSFTPSGTPSPSITPSISATPSSTGTSSPTSSTSPSTSSTSSSTPSVTTSPTQTPSTSSTPTPSTTPSATPTPSITPSMTPTSSPAVVAVPADFQGELAFDRPVLALAPQGMISFLVMDSQSENACSPASKGETGAQLGRNYTSYHVEADLSSVLSAPPAALAPPSSKLHCGRSYGGTRWTPGVTPCNIEFDCRPLHEFGLAGSAVHCEPLFPETAAEETAVEQRLVRCNGSVEPEEAHGSSANATDSGANNGTSDSAVPRNGSVATNGTDEALASNNGTMCLQNVSVTRTRPCRPQYRLVHSILPRDLGPEARAARLLEQAAYGGTWREIQAMAGRGKDVGSTGMPADPGTASSDTSIESAESAVRAEPSAGTIGSATGSFSRAAESWYWEQVAMSPTLHRAHYRSNANPRARLGSTPGKPFSSCDVGSRWVSFSIHELDRGSEFRVVNGTLLVGGHPRTFVGQSFTPAPGSGSGPWHVCEVEEEVGGLVTYRSPASGCIFAWTNPAVQFPTEAIPAGHMPLQQVQLDAEARSQHDGPAHGSCLMSNGSAANAGSAAANATSSLCSQSQASNGTSSVAESARQAIDASQVQMKPVAAPAKDSYVLVGASTIGQPAGSCESRAPGPAFALASILGTNRTMWLQHQGRLRLASNTLENPCSGIDAQTCSHVPRLPFNADTCRLLPSCSRVTRRTAGAGRTVHINESFILKIQELTGRQVFQILDLPMYQMPVLCHQPVARFKRVQRQACEDASEPGSVQIDEQAHALYSAAIIEADDGADVIDAKDVSCVWANRGVRINVVYSEIMPVNSTAGSVTNSTSSANSTVTASPKVHCFDHVHPDEGQVFDFTAFGSEHAWQVWSSHKEPPLAAAVRREQTSITYPTAGHPIGYWNQKRDALSSIGRMGQTLRVDELPLELQHPDIVGNHNDGMDEIDCHEVVRACGSPGEESNDPEAGHRYTFSVDGNSDVERLSLDVHSEGMQGDATRDNVWANAVLHAPDQLRQRVAMALAQLVGVTVENTGRSGEAEAFAAYWDILVRRGLGPLRELLHEVFHSPMVGEAMGYTNDRSIHYHTEIFPKRELYPDETMARAALQRFTAGRHLLHMNGTLVLDDASLPTPAWTQADVEDLSGAWTGLATSPMRGNIEASRASATVNAIDPLHVPQGVADAHDARPKMSPGGAGHVGDYLPRCEHLGTQAFLEAGAAYHYISRQEAELDRHRSGVEPLVLDDTGSPLHAALCGMPGPYASCIGTMRATVRLNKTLPCRGADCSVDTVRVVQVNRGNSGVPPAYFRYERLPCAELAFVEDGRGLPTTLWSTDAMCVDERLPAAAASCCSEASRTWEAEVPCVAHEGQLVSMATAVQQCASRGSEVCENTYPRFACGSVSTTRIWGTRQCAAQVRVFPDGRVQAVHDMHEPFRSQRDARVSTTSSLYGFRVKWTNGSYPVASDYGTSAEPCTRLDDGSVLCNARIGTEPVFTAALPVTLSEMEHALKVGARDPAVYGPGVYMQCAAPECDALQNRTGATVWIHRDSSSPGLGGSGGGSGLALDAQTIFRARLGGRTRFLFNQRASVSIVDDAGTPLHSFRNPPQVVSLHSPTAADIHGELGATADTLVRHANTPQHLALFFIRSLVTANPSAAYVQRVAQAAADGSYRGRGTGERADLGATIAAVLLDPEALSPELEMDPMHGRLKDPLVKTMQIMRAGQLTTENGAMVELGPVSPQLGQGVYEQPDIQDLVRPVQDVSRSADWTVLMDPPDVVLPGAERLTDATMVGYQNAVLGLTTSGLLPCDGGLGSGRGPADCDALASGSVPPADLRAGYLNLSSALGDEHSTVGQLVDRADVLLTGGRMSNDTKKAIESTLQSIRRDPNRNEQDVRSAVMYMAASSPAFHAVGAKHRPASRAPPSASPVRTRGGNAGDDYQALIMLVLAGGHDSWNMIVPLDECKGGVDRLGQYQSLRGSAGMHSGHLLGIDVPNGTQPCNRFGVHLTMPLLKQLYEQNDTAFIANIGSLVTPVGKADAMNGTDTFPDGLLEHGPQMRAAHRVGHTDTGVLARLQRELIAQGQKGVHLFSASGAPYALRGDTATGTTGAAVADVLEPRIGVRNLDPRDTMTHVPVMDLYRVPSGSLATSVWPARAPGAVDRQGALAKDLQAGSLQQWFHVGDNEAARQLRQVAQTISTRHIRGATRDMFVVTVPGFDSHSDYTDTQYGMQGKINTALDSFQQELKLQGVWSNTTIVQLSEFGRRLRPSGHGTDHGWGGHAAVLGGSVRGGRILGRYPADLSEAGTSNIHAGRMIPSMPWEGLWAAVAEQLGLPRSGAAMRRVLPRLGRFLSAQEQGNGTVAKELQGYVLCRDELYV